MTQLELDEIRDKWLALCGYCDAGLPMSCTHPEGDYRPVMLRLVAEVERLRANQADQRRIIEAQDAALRSSRKRASLSRTDTEETTP